jgi:transposase InsO family protein
MPFREDTPVDQRKQFVRQALRHEQPFSELCQHYGISRPTGYKWLERYHQGGVPALEDRPSAPRRHPNQTPEAVEQRILALRDQLDNRYGARKLKAILESLYPCEAWPAASTIGAVLRRHGRTAPPKRRRRTPPSTQPFAAVEAPNQLWCADFKGHFRTQDGARVDPLTITDGFSRYLLRVQIVDRLDTASARGVFTAAFREYGLPLAMRTDNGSPFASTAPGGLSRLSAEWVRRGIRPERIEAGKPQQNGRHERMHRTLKDATAAPPAATKRRQQQRFHDFQTEFNELRPHEALDYQPPASAYSASARQYQSRLPEIEYPPAMLLRRVSRNGDLHWKGRPAYLTEVLAGEVVGLDPLDDRYYEVFFSFVPLGRFDTHKCRFQPYRGSKTR